MGSARAWATRGVSTLNPPFADAGRCHLVLRRPNLNGELEMARSHALPYR